MIFISSGQDSLVIFVSPGQEIDLSVLQGLLQASELVNEKYLNFVKERLVQRLNQYSSHHQSQILKQVTEKKPRKTNSFSSETRQTGNFC